MANWLDRAISFFSPSAGIRRAEARAWLGEIERTTPSDIRSRLSSYEGPKAEAAGTRIDALREGRRLIRTNEYTMGVVQAITDNVVGPLVRFESKIQAGGRAAKSRNERMEALVRGWAKRVSTDGRRSLTETVALLERESWVAGEALIVRTITGDPMRPRLALEVVESERLANLDSVSGGLRGVSPGNRVYQGVEYRPDGTIAAYHLYKMNPIDAGAEPTLEIERVRAERVIHYYAETRPGQVRGVSRIGPLASSFDATNQVMNYAIDRERTASSFALMINRNRGRPMTLPADTSQSATDSNGNAIGNLHGGLLVWGQHGDEMKSAESTVSSSFDAFITVALRRLAVGLNVSYELLTRDFSKHNFSSMRQSFLEDRRHWEARRMTLATVLEQVLEWFYELAMLTGQMRGISRSDLDAMSFTFTGWDWVDPKKEIEADIAAIRAGLKSPFEVAQRRGFDVGENVTALGRMRQMYEDAGLTPPSEIFENGQQKAAEAEARSEKIGDGDDDEENDAVPVRAA